MARHHLINGIRVAFTAEEETAWDNAETAWNNGALSRAQANLRSKRNRLLAETDFYALSDVTMSDEMKNIVKILEIYLMVKTQLKNVITLHFQLNHNGTC